MLCIYCIFMDLNAIISEPCRQNTTTIPDTPSSCKTVLVSFVILHDSYRYNSQSIIGVFVSGTFSRRKCRKKKKNRYAKVSKLNTRIIEGGGRKGNRIVWHFVLFRFPRRHEPDETMEIFIVNVQPELPGGIEVRGVR